MVVAGQNYTTCDYAKKVTKSGAVFFQMNILQKKNIYIYCFTYKSISLSQLFYCLLLFYKPTAWL